VYRAVYYTDRVRGKAVGRVCDRVQTSDDRVLHGRVRAVYTKEQLNNQATGLLSPETEIA